MTDALLRIEGLTKRFGGITATDDLHLEVPEGQLHAVIGPNGAGKTTLIAQLAGELRADAGRVHFAGRDMTRLPPHARSAMGLARSFQVTSILQDFTALENVLLAVQAHAGHAFRFWSDARHDRRLSEPARASLERVGLAARAEARAANLSHGEQRQLEIAMALATRPRMLLLDEPMAGMGAEESTRMVALMQTLRREHTILLVEHDMDVVFALAEVITVLVYGRSIASGTPEAIRNDPRVREAYLGEGDHAAPAAHA